MRHLVIVSDLHCGSTVGLLPPGFTTHEGQEIRLNAAQEYLWGCWSSFWDQVNSLTDGDYHLLVNGDLTEGVHHKSTQVISPDPGDHAVAAIKALRPVVKKGRLLVTEGTECHTGNMEHYIARELGGKAYPRLDLEIGTTRLSASHHISATKRPYLESSAMGMDLNSERLEALRGGHPVPDVIIRSHRHRYGLFSDESGMLLVTPPWQLLTRFGHKVVPAASCHIGGVLLTFGDGVLPAVKPIIFKPLERPSVRAN